MVKSKNKKKRKPRWQWWSKKRLRETALEEVKNILTRREYRKISRREFAKLVREKESEIVANWKMNGKDPDRPHWNAEFQRFARSGEPGWYW